MATRPRPSQRRRARPGSLERPINGRMYRGTWLLVGIPLLIAAFSVARPEPLPAPALPPAFDERAAVQAAEDFARLFPERTPGTPGARRARDWVSDQFVQLGYAPPEVDRFHAKIAGRGDVELENVVVRRTGGSADTIVVMAHRDNTGAGPGANDNGSGTAALIELARAYAEPAVPPRPPDPRHTIVFLSTDGGAYGALGAARFASSETWRDRVVAVVNLDAIAGRSAPRLEIAGDRSRAPDPVLVRTAAARILQQAGAEPETAPALGQVLDLAFPFSVYEHAPFVGRGVAAITLTTAGSRPPRAFDDSDLNAQRLGQLGRSAQALVTSLDEQVALAQGTSSYVYLGPRVVRGWALVLILIAALLPCLAAIVDLFARLRRRRIPLAPALRSYRSRLGFWLFVGLLFEAFALVGVWPDGAARPLPLESSAGTDWPVVGLAVFTCFSLTAWFVARQRLVPRRHVMSEEELAGYTAALLALAVVALLVIATNAYALLFLLPSLHAWLWLAHVRDSSVVVRASLLAGGFLGPALLMGSLALRYDLGFDAPWYLAGIAAVGYVPLASVFIVCAWLAAAAQLVTLVARRYAPYPDASEQPPASPLRLVARRALRAVQARRSEQAVRREAAG